MSAEAQLEPVVLEPTVLEPVVEDWMAVHLPRRAQVEYPHGWGWPGQPHPSCRKAEIRVPPDGDADAPVEAWVVIRPALAHDRHVLATGASCAGVPGTLPATRRAVHEDRLQGALAGLAQARARLLAAQRDVVHLDREVTRARALVEMSRGLEEQGR